MITVFQAKEKYSLAFLLEEQTVVPVTRLGSRASVDGK